MKRNEFIHSMTALLLMHSNLSFAFNSTDKKNSVLIDELFLPILNISVLEKFYKDIGFNVSKNNTQLKIYIGKGIINFYEDKNLENPFFHFAFNIPQNKIEEARDFMKSKVNLLSKDGEDIIHFINFNAHSIFFEDPAGNIVEFIARHNLNNDDASTFSLKQLLNISEIGLVSESVVADATDLNNLLGVDAYNPLNENFTPIGSEEGMIIIVKKERPWVVANTPAKIFPVKVKVKTKRPINYSVSASQFNLFNT